MFPPLSRLISVNERMVQLGDMVIQRGGVKWQFGKGQEYIGFVYKLSRVGGHDSAFLFWTPEDPPNYNKNYGYARINIHNDHACFEVIKK